MATLEKIRAKQGLLFGVIIVALFLFILTLAGNPFESCTHNPNNETVIKAGDIKVSNEEFQKWKQPKDVQAQQQGANKDAAALNQQLVMQYLMERMIAREAENLGLAVPDANLAQVIELVSPYEFTVLARAFNTTSAAQIASIISNPKSMNMTKEGLDGMAKELGYTSIENLWKAVEDQAELQMQSMILGDLVSGLFTANKLDAKAAYEDQFKLRQVSYVSIPFAVNTEEIAATDEEVKKKWEETKSEYKIQEPTRVIEYILVKIDPSQEDIDKAKAEMDEFQAEFQATPAGEAHRAFPKTEYQSGTMTLKAMRENPEYAVIPDSVVVPGGVWRFRDTPAGFSMLRFIDVTQNSDTVNFSQCLAENAAMLDSIVTGLGNGTVTFKEMADNKIQAMDSVAQGNLSRLQGEDKTMMYGFVDAYKSGNPIKVDTITMEGAEKYVVTRVNSISAPETIIDVEYVKKDLVPSKETTTTVKHDLTNFVATNGTAEKFSKAAAESAKYNAIKAAVTPSSAHINDDVVGNIRVQPILDSREAVKWAMNAKPGEVSKIYSRNSDGDEYLLVVALKEAIDDDYVPYNSELIYDDLKEIVVADKRAQKIGAQYSGKANLQEVATASGQQVANNGNFSMASQMFGAFPNNAANAALFGKIAGAKADKLYGPVRTANSVVFFTVSDPETQVRDLNDSDYNSFMQNFGIKDFQKFLLGDSKFENRLLEVEYVQTED